MGTRQSHAQIGTELSFTLLEAASYSIATSFDGFFTPHEPSDSAAIMSVGLEAIPKPEFWHSEC